MWLLLTLCHFLYFNLHKWSNSVLLCDMLARQLAASYVRK